MNIKEIFYIIVLIFVFYRFGFLISSIVDMVFPRCDYKKENKSLIMETILQLILIFCFFIFFNKKIRTVVDIIFKNVTNHKMNDISLTIVIIAFSSGVFKHLDELKMKIEYLKKSFFS